MSCTRTIRKLNNEQIRKFHLPIFISLCLRIAIAEARVLTKTIEKPPNRKVRLLFSILVNFGFKCKRTKQTLLRRKTHLFHKMVSTRKPLLLTFFQTLHTMATRNTNTVIIFKPIGRNRNVHYFRHLAIVRINKCNLTRTHHIQR